MATCSRSLVVGISGLLALLAAAAIFSPAEAAISPTSRVDAGPPIEVRINEAFDITPGAIYDDSSSGIEPTDSWWDLDNTTDNNPRNGDFIDDKDNYNQTILGHRMPRLGAFLFTLWVNYTDGRLFNSSRFVTVVENDPPTITLGSSPTGFAGENVQFVVTVNDLDSPEATLQYSWDFDVNVDTGFDGVPDNDIDSTEKSNVFYVYVAENSYTAKLIVKDDYNATAEVFIPVVIVRAPGITAKTFEVGDFKQDNVTVKKDGWVAYHFHVRAGRLYQYEVTVTNNVPIYVMVAFGQQQFDQYVFRASPTAYVAEWSHVDTRDIHIIQSFRPTQDGELWVILDNGFLFGVGSGQAAEAAVTLQDMDRGNLFANIPWFVWPVLAIAGLGIAGFFGVRAYVAGAETRRAENEKRAIANQERTMARSELDMLLATKGQMPPPPPPPPPPVYAPPPPPLYAPVPAPAPAGPRGPSPPPGYAPRQGPAPGPAPAPGYGPQPAGAAYGPRPGPAPGGPRPVAPAAPLPAPGPAPAPAAAGLACANCGQPTEGGWQICPNCGSGLMG